MIVYFADRQFNIQGTASTWLPYGIRIIDDSKTESLETGVKTFSCTFIYDEESGPAVRKYVTVGNYLLRASGDESELYQIVTREHDSVNKTVNVYAEDAGLDLLNNQAAALENKTSHDLEWYVSKYLPKGWAIGINELSGTRSVEWESETTVTERLLSIATNFDGEIGFSYEVKGLSVINRYVDFYEHRGSETSVAQLRVGIEVENVVTNESIENLATAFTCYGGTPSGKDKPINLSGADYSSDGKTTHSPAVATDDYQIVGKQVRCKSAMQTWASKLDTDGLLLREYTYDTTNKKTLFSHAVAELRKVIAQEINYTVTFIKLPENIRLGDRVSVVDDDNELYVEGRILSITKSVTGDKTEVVLGDYVTKDSGISDRLANIARGLNGKDGVDGIVLTISSSNGVQFLNQSIATVLTVTVFYGDKIITNQEQLEEVFGESARLVWNNDLFNALYPAEDLFPANDLYPQDSAIEDGRLSDDGFTLTVSSNNTQEMFTCELITEEVA